MECTPPGIGNPGGHKPLFLFALLDYSILANPERTANKLWIIIKSSDDERLFFGGGEGVTLRDRDNHRSLFILELLDVCQA